MKMTADLVGTLLKGRKQANGNWLCKCPGHSDKHESFSVGDRNNNVVMTCFAGCKQNDLFLKVKGMFEDHYGKTVPTTRTKVREIQNVYHDMHGAEQYRNDRIEFDDGSKTFSMKHKFRGEWEPGRGDVDFAPFHYSKWKDELQIFLVEGEKCVLACEAIGVHATCVPGGAKAWNEKFKKYFENKEVIILPDNDVPGIDFAQAAHTDILSVGSPIILNLPLVEKGDDIVDWLASGGSKEKLLDLVAVAKQSPIEAMGFGDEYGKTDFIEIVQLENAQKTIRFGIPFLDDVWDGMLPTDLCVAAAKSGIGKTQFAMNMAKAVMCSGGSVAMYALEAFKHEIGMRMIYTIAVGNYLRMKKPYQPYASFADWVRGDLALVAAMEPYTKYACEYAEKHWGDKFYTHYLKQRFTIEDFENSFPIIAKKCDLVILDHLHYISKTNSKQNSMDFLGEAVGRVKEMVVKYRTPVLMIVHVRKEDSFDRKPIPDVEDIHGSSDIFKIATKAVCMGRPFENGYNAEDNTQKTYFKIPKDRLGNVPDWMVAKMTFNRNEQIYLPDYELIKLNKDRDKGWSESPVIEKPYWFGRSSKAQSSLMGDF